MHYKLVSYYKKDPFATLAVIFGSILTIFLFLINLNKNLSNIDYATYFILFIILVLFYSHLLPQLGMPTPKGVIFQGVKQLEIEEAWKRPKQTMHIIEYISNLKNNLGLISGPSGSGKSILIETQVKPELENNGWKVIIISDYSKIQTEIINKIRTKVDLSPEDITNLRKQNFEALSLGAPNFNFLIIFDQMERLTTQSYKELTWIREFIKNYIKNPNIYFAIIIRQDFYYSLRFLGDLLPSPNKAIEITGLEIESNSEDGILIKEKLEQVVEPEVVNIVIKDLEKEVFENVTDSLGNSIIRRIKIVLPLDLQMVGLMLEIEANKGDKISKNEYEQKLLGKKGLISKYFSSYLNASPYKNIAKSVLYSLSTEKVLRKSLSLKNISSITYQKKEVVKEILDFFYDEGLIVVGKGNRMYEWTHDSLSSGFREYSGGEMDPIVRDNITYLADMIQRGEYFFSNILPHSKIIIREKTINTIMVIITLLISLRMLLGGVLKSNPGFYDLKQILESLYIPFGFSHLIWSFVVNKLQKNIFARIKMNSIKLIQWLIYLVGFPCLIITFILPKFWILALALTGIAIGISFIRISLKKNISNQSKARFKNLGFSYLYYAVTIIGGIGLAFYFGSPILFNNIPKYENWISCFLSIFSIIYAWFLMRKDLTAESILALLGLLDRKDIEDNKLLEDVEIQSLSQ